MTVDKKPVPQDLIDQLLANYKKPEDLIGEDGLLKQLTKALVGCALAAEMAVHLGHGRHELVENATGNTRNGKSKKTLKGEFGELPIEIPRDRHGCFEPQLVGKHQTRWTGFDDKILSLYARGMTVREIQVHLTEMYGTEVSPTLISSVTDAVMDEVKTWQARPFDALYPIVYLDCIHVKARDSGALRSRPSTWRSVSISKVRRSCLASGSRKGKVRSFGYRSSRSLRTAAWPISSSPASTGSKASPRPLKRSTPRRRCSCASCTWCATA